MGVRAEVSTVVRDHAFVVCELAAHSTLGGVVIQTGFGEVEAKLLKTVKTVTTMALFLLQVKHRRRVKQAHICGDINVLAKQLTFFFLSFLSKIFHDKFESNRANLAYS